MCPVVLTAWGTDIGMTEDPSCDPVPRWCKSEAVSNAALLIADSDDIIDIATALTQHCVPTKLIPIGDEYERFPAGERASWRKEFAIPPTATVALSPRGFQARYGHELLSTPSVGRSPRDS